MVDESEQRRGAGAIRVGGRDNDRSTGSTTQVEHQT